MHHHRLALRRARARRHNAGAVMFIVAVTLGLLAVMGIYGLSATSADIRAAGHMREAIQGQKATEAALMLTAETYNPVKAQGLVDRGSSGPTAGTGQGGQATNCKTAAPYTGNVDTRDAEACVKLDLPAMAILAAPVNPWASPFTAQSFGASVNLPYVTVEVTNPITTTVPAGNSITTISYTTVTATIFTQLKPNAGVAAETSLAGRARIIVGPTYGVAVSKF